jgi:hypothetical protein
MILIDYVNRIESSVEFINDNETEIVSILTQNLMLQQNMAVEGSGTSSKIKDFLSIIL